MSSEFIDFVLEQMASVPNVRAKAMFGGHGVYQGEIFFAIIDDERLYFKADDESETEFTSRGLRPFTIVMRGKKMSMRYYEAPAEAMDDPAAMSQWANRAIAAAKRAKKQLRARKPSKPRSRNTRRRK